MKEKTTINQWMLLFFALVIFVLFLLGMLLIQQAKQEEVYDFGNVELKQSTIKDIKENFNKDFIICRVGSNLAMDEDYCIKLISLKE